MGAQNDLGLGGITAHGMWPTFTPGAEDIVAGSVPITGNGKDEEMSDKGFWFGLLLTVICGLALIAGMWWLLTALNEHPVTLIVVLSVLSVVLAFSIWRQLRD